MFRALVPAKERNPDHFVLMVGNFVSLRLLNRIQHLLKDMLANVCVIRPRLMRHGSRGAHGARRNSLLLRLLHGFNKVVLARELLDIAARRHPFEHWIALNLVDGHAIVL